MVGFDFDKTIYNGDSGVDLAVYCCLKRPYLILTFAPYIIVCTLLYALRIIKRDTLKNQSFKFMKAFKDKDKVIQDFWKTHKKKIKPLFYEKKGDSCFVISATPMFIVKPICDEIGVNTTIATEYDLKTYKMTNLNCVSENKEILYNQVFGENTEIEEFYSDCYKDIPMLRKAKKGYIVKGNDIAPYEEALPKKKLEKF
jgi:phosphatidylglycerophosphatase C